MATQSVKADLLSALSEEADITIEAAAVERVGTAGIQVLLSAVQTFSSHGHEILINEPSEALQSALSLAAIVLPNCSNSETRLLNA